MAQRPPPPPFPPRHPARKTRRPLSRLNLLRPLASLALLVRLVTFPRLAPATPSPDHALFSQVLAAHVRDGRVDYLALRTAARLPRYLAQLGATNPATLAPGDPAATSELRTWLATHLPATAAGE